MQRINYSFISYQVCVNNYCFFFKYLLLTLNSHFFFNCELLLLLNWDHVTRIFSQLLNRFCSWSYSKIILECPTFIHFTFILRTARVWDVLPEWVCSDMYDMGVFKSKVTGLLLGKWASSFAHHQARPAVIA